MDKKYIEALQSRYILVGQRLEALNIEKESLDAERDSLSALLNVYQSRGNYDSIEEERRVTAALTEKPKTPKAKPCGDRYMHEDALALIFGENHGTPLMVSDITRAINDLEGCNIAEATVFVLLRRLVNDGYATKVARGNKQFYVYNGRKCK